MYHYDQYSGDAVIIIIFIHYTVRVLLVSLYLSLATKINPVLTSLLIVSHRRLEFGTDTARMGAGSKQNYIKGLRFWTSSVKIVALHFCGKVWGSKRCA